MKARNQALWGLWGQIGGCQNILAIFSYTIRERGSVSHRGNFSRERLQERKIFPPAHPGSFCFTCYEFTWQKQCLYIVMSPIDATFSSQDLSSLRKGPGDDLTRSYKSGVIFYLFLHALTSFLCPISIARTLIRYRPRLVKRWTTLSTG